MGQVIYSGPSSSGVIVFDAAGVGFVFCPRGLAVTVSDELEASLLTQGSDRWLPGTDGAPAYVIPSPPLPGDVVVDERDAVDGAFVVFDSTSTYGYSLRSPESVVPFSRPGALGVGAGSARYYVRDAARLVDVQASVGVPAEGLPVIVDVNLNGVSVFTDPADRPTIQPGEFVSQLALPDVVDVAAGDYLTVDVDQVGVAVPAFVDSSTGNDVYSGTNISLPRPAGAQTGDLLFAFIQHSPVANVITPPAGWTEIGASVSTGGTGGPQRMSRFFKVDDGAAGPFVFVASAGVSWGKPRCAAYRNVVGEIDDSTTSPAVFDRTFNGPGLTTSAPSDLLLLWGNSAQSPGTVTPPAGFTNRFAGGMYLADSVAASPGIVNDVATTNQNNSDNIAGLIAFKADQSQAVPGSDLVVSLRVAG